MALNVGHIEHIRSIQLPLASSDDAAVRRLSDDVAHKVFAQGNDEFEGFSRLPTEIQVMIWKATFKPRIVRAIAYSELINPNPVINDPDPDDDDILLENLRSRPPQNHWLLLECNPLHVRYLSAYSVCHSSRAVALETYGPLLDNNITPFQPDLDTLEVVGWNPTTKREGNITRVVSRYASVQDGIGLVMLPPMLLKIMNGEITWNAETGPIYLKAAIILANNTRNLKPSRQKWALIKAPFERARNVVFCYDTWFPARLDAISIWARAMLPNTEVLTMRTYVLDMQRIKEMRSEEEIDQSDLEKSVRSILLEPRVRFWPRLKTIHFTRQCISEYVR